MKRSYRIFIWILLIMMLGCIDPYEFDVEQGTPRIVVEGGITNLPGPYEVIITESGNYSLQVDGVSEFISNAQVYIIDDLGEIELLYEKAQGRYFTGDLIGQVGRSYYIEIILPGGETYRSEPELLTLPPSIKEVYYEFEPGSVTKELGFHVYLETDDPADEINYYKWESISWWLYSWDCWYRVHDQDPFNIKSDKNVNGNKIARQFIKVVPYNSTLPFVVTALQISLSPSAYSYIENVKKQVMISGSIFDPPPTFLRGNIENVKNPENVALGYFYVSGVTTKEIAIDRTGIPFSPVNPVYPHPKPLYCGDPCNYLCVTLSKGICGVEPCPPDCNNLPNVTYIPPEAWPLPHTRCDEE